MPEFHKGKKMSIIINTNVSASLSSKHLEKNQRSLDGIVERLSAGKKTIKAADDAAGIAIANKMESQIRGLNTTVRHVKSGQSVVATSEAAMKEIGKILQNMRELALQSSSGTASSGDKNFLNVEMTNLVSEIGRVASDTIFNGGQLLNGDQFTFYTDINIDGLNITTVAANMSPEALGVSSATVDIGASTSQTDLDDVVAAIDAAIATVSTKRAHLGAVSNRFDHIVGNLQNIIDSTVRSRGIIIDADFSAETTELTKSSMLREGATSMLAQANSQKNLVLSLFQQ